MLTYLCTAEAIDTTADFLADCEPALASRIVVRTYEELATTQQLRAGTYLFSDLERLTAEGLLLAERLWVRLAAATPGQPPLNRPSRHRRRKDLLDALAAAGINAFRAYRPDDPAQPWRYPVFLRYENEHWGPMTGLLRSGDELRRALRRARLLGHRTSDLLVVEFCDTRGGDGRYRKYGAYVVGDAIMPCQVFFSRGWAPRLPVLVDSSTVREEREYLESNPHERELRKVVEIAGVEYGRIDYAIAGGDVQIWEVNTNPNLSRRHSAPERHANTAYSTQRLGRLLGALATLPPGPEIAVGDLWEGGRWPTRSRARTARRARVAKAVRARLGPGSG